MKIKIHFNRDENLKYYNEEISEIDLDEYIWGVVGAEIGNSHIEACKALAIAARTNAMPYVDKDKIISDTSPQAFRSSRLTNSYNNARDAAKETSGCVLYYNGKLANPASYSSSNGGRTTSSKERWGSARAWLIEQDDPWDYGKKTGHGVGMSQRGCQQMAKAGKTYKEILEFYYPGTTIEGGDTVAKVKASYLVDKFKYMVDNKWKYEAGAARYGYVDCSGAFSYWYKQGGSYMYHGSNTMYRKYSVSRGKIGEMQLIPGMAVFKWKNDGKEPAAYKNDGIGNMHHVGLYLGNGMVAEAKGTKYGCVYSNVSEWHYAALLVNTEYDYEEKEKDAVTGTVTVTSGSLNVRKGPGTNYGIIGSLKNKEQVYVLDQEGSWYKIKFNNSYAYCSSKYVVLNSGEPVKDDEYQWKIICTIKNEDTLNRLAEFFKTEGVEYTCEKEGAT